MEKRYNNNDIDSRHQNNHEKDNADYKKSKKEKGGNIEKGEDFESKIIEASLTKAYNNR